jgi:hypothetical protein
VMTGSAVSASSPAATAGVAAATGALELGLEQQRRRNGSDEQQHGDRPEPAGDQLSKRVLDEAHGVSPVSFVARGGVGVAAAGGAPAATGRWRSPRPWRRRPDSRDRRSRRARPSWTESPCRTARTRTRRR